jgi:tetratricopeptide (TPR) repeat protein
MMQVHAIRTGLATAGAVLTALFFAMPAAAQETGSGGGRARVLVAPIAEQSGVKRNFGRKVSERVMEDLQDVATLTAIEEDAVDDELKRLKLKQEDLGLVQWRQLAGRLNADIILHGTVSKGSGGNVFNVAFIDAQTGDATEIPQFSVQDDGNSGAQEAAGHIMDAIEGQVDYQRALLFCNDYLASEQYEDAARNCEAALEYNPNSQTAKYLMGRLYMGQENWEEARDLLSDVVESNQANIDALNSLAYTEAQLGNKDRALELYRQYLGFNPEDASVRMQIAFDLAKAGEFDGAIELLQEGLARDSTNVEMWEFLGNVALNKGTSGGSDVLPDSMRAADGAGMQDAGDTGGLTSGGQDDAALALALEAYNKVLDLKGAETDPQILKNVVAVYLQLDDLTEARRFAERAQEQLPEDATLRSLQADICARSEDFACAVTAMNEALRLNPELERGLTKRAFFKLSAGDEAGAETDMRAAIEKGEDQDVIAQQLLSRGYNDYFKGGQYERAVAMFETATEFASVQQTREQLYFFTAFSRYQIGVNLDSSNSAEACGPARRALNQFEQVLPALNRAGSFQAENQAQVRESTDVYLYREQAILKKPACRSGG